MEYHPASIHLHLRQFQPIPEISIGLKLKCAKERNCSLGVLISYNKCKPPTRSHTLRHRRFLLRLFHRCGPPRSDGHGEDTARSTEVSRECDLQDPPCSLCSLCSRSHAFCSSQRHQEIVPACVSIFQNISANWHCEVSLTYLVK